MRILIIEDEEAVAHPLQRGLKSAIHSADIAATGKEGVRLAATNDYDLVILDYYLPDMNGEEVAKMIKGKKHDLPIIVLSNEPNTEVKVDMLAICDDYVVKPFSLEELVARIRAVARRGANVIDQVLALNGLEICPESFEVRCDGKAVALSNKEFALLQYLMNNHGRVLSRTLILEKVWDMNVDPFTHTVDVHIQRLREKIGRRGKEFIVTVPGMGYKFVATRSKKEPQKCA